MLIKSLIVHSNPYLNPSKVLTNVLNKYTYFACRIKEYRIEKIIAERKAAEKVKRKAEKKAVRKEKRKAKREKRKANK